MLDYKALGIDVGSTTTKIAALDGEGRLVWHTLEETEPWVERQLERLLDEILPRAQATAEIPLIATGYGRNLVQRATRQVTEISCHARGIFHEFGHGGTLVDIGGQDSKAIRVSDSGRVLDFAMNDKCAAGTGRFLENTALRLKVPVDQIGDAALSTGEEVDISSTCTVFAESEIVSLIAQGVQVPPILRGLHRSLIRRIVSMILLVHPQPPLMLSGGVVQNPAIRKLLEEETGQETILPRYPQLTGAYGAALLALEL